MYQPGRVPGVEMRRISLDIGRVQDCDDCDLDS